MRASAPGSLAFAPCGRSGWTVVYCRCCRTPLWYACSAAEARIYLMDEQAPLPGCRAPRRIDA